MNPLRLLTNILQVFLPDMAHFGWLYFAVKMGAIDGEKYPRLIIWHDKIISRPAVVTGLTVPEPSNFK